MQNNLPQQTNCLYLFIIIYNRFENLELWSQILVYFALSLTISEISANFLCDLISSYVLLFLTPFLTFWIYFVLTQILVSLWIFWNFLKIIKISSCDHVQCMIQNFGPFRSFSNRFWNKWKFLEILSCDHSQSVSSPKFSKTIEIFEISKKLKYS